MSKEPDSAIVRQLIMGDYLYAGQQDTGGESPKKAAQVVSIRCIVVAPGSPAKQPNVCVSRAR
jgi:hypothetical protein